MTHKRLLFIAMFTAATFVLEAGAEPAAERQYVDGGVMAGQIRSHLASEGFSPITKIDVEANENGSVVLKGEAASDAEATRAVNVAKEVNGVTSVRSEILVRRIR